MFYILSIFIIGLIIPYDDPNLLKSDVSDITVSPFTLVFQKAGMDAAARKSIVFIAFFLKKNDNHELYVDR